MADILVIGGANLDIKARSQSPHQYGTSNPGHVATFPGGVARNIAHNLARLGADVGLISSLGADPQGQIVLEATRAAGVDITRVMTTAPATGTYLAFLNNTGELVTAMSDMRAVDAITAVSIAQQANAISRARFVVADCNLPLVTLQAIADLARNKLIVEPVSVAKSAKLQQLLGSGTIFLASPNIDQIENLTRTRNIPQACAVLHRMGLANIVVHAGAGGAFVSDGTTVQHVPAVSAGPVVDVTGAGDAAVAGLVFGLVKGESLVKAASFGQKLAGEVITTDRSTLE